MKEELFDLTQEYEAMLNRGISLSGEDMLFFVGGRLEAVHSWLQKNEKRPVLNCLDFGCGLGHTTKRLANSLGAQCTGVDTSENSLQMAQVRNGGPDTRYMTLADLDRDPLQYDLCYVNGVFHHISPAERPEALALIYRKLRPSGLFFFFENNPWNPGARMVMARIPFDRDAIMISPRQAAGLLRATGFGVEAVRSYFFFPHFLKALRVLDSVLSRSPLGAQYLMVGRKAA